MIFIFPQIFSHITLTGNEQTDVNAKEALGLQEITEVPLNNSSETTKSNEQA